MPTSRAVLERAAEIRYVGQEHTLPVTVTADSTHEEIRAAFEELHRARYGHAMDNQLQLLNVRVRGIGRTDRVELSVFPSGDGDPSQASTATRQAFDFGTRKSVEFTVYDRALLRPGNSVDGPALVEAIDTTIVVPEGTRLSIDAYGTGIIEGVK